LDPPPEHPPPGQCFRSHFRSHTSFPTYNSHPLQPNTRSGFHELRTHPTSTFGTWSGGHSWTPRGALSRLQPVLVPHLQLPGTNPSPRRRPPSTLTRGARFLPRTQSATRFRSHSRPSVPLALVPTSTFRHTQHSAQSRFHWHHDHSLRSLSHFCGSPAPSRTSHGFRPMSASFVTCSTRLREPVSATVSTPTPSRSTDSAFTRFHVHFVSERSHPFPALVH